jgi:trigger factor
VTGWGFNSPLSHHVIALILADDNVFRERLMNVEMNVSVVDLSANQKKLQVQIPALKVQEELDEKYRDLGKRIRIKGFRPGKVPRNIIKSYYGKTVENELSSQFIQETFPDALREANLKPLVEADVSEVRFEDNGTFTYIALVDVSPPFDMEEYKGLALHRPSVEISETQVEAELERIRQQHAQLRSLETPRPIAEGDVVLVDLLPTVDGNVFEKGKATDYMVEIGKQTIHPELDQHLIGHQSGESVAVDLDYPEDAPTREVAGKRVHFEVAIREIKEKLTPELDDEFAKEVGQFETLEALKQTVREQLQKRESDKGSAEIRQQIIDQLLPKVDIELSPRVIEREVDRLLGMLHYQFESQGLKLDRSRFNTPEIRAEYRSQAEKNVRWNLICEYLAKREELSLSDYELEEIYGEVARAARVDVETLKRDYADSAIVEQAKDGRLQDKVLKMLEDAAVFSEIAAAEEDSLQE